LSSLVVGFLDAVAEEPEETDNDSEEKEDAEGCRFILRSAMMLHASPHPPRYFCSPVLLLQRLTAEKLQAE
jgi:hypothetical protein